MLLLRLRAAHLRDALGEPGAPEPVHLPRPRLRRAEKLALARELRVLHPRALRQRREPVAGDGPQTRRVVLTAHLVE